VLTIPYIEPIALNAVDKVRLREALPKFLLIAALTTGVAVIIGEFLLIAAFSTGVLMVAPSTEAILLEEPQGIPHATHLSVASVPSS
jgi:hypothetical protein